MGNQKTHPFHHRKRRDFPDGILINGNSIDVLPQLEEQLKIDMVITDPPYNISFKYLGYKDSLPDEEYIELIRTFKSSNIAIIQYPEEMMKYIVPALGVPDEVLCWCYNSNIPRRFRLINCYRRKPDFSRVIQPYKNPKDKRIAALLEKGKVGTPVYDWFSDIQLVKNVSKEKTIHPCPIPEKLIERLILLLTEEHDTILDPFMGCGTVPAVCRKLNRRFVGVELDSTYFDVAVERIEGIKTRQSKLDVSV